MASKSKATKTPERIVYPLTEQMRKLLLDSVDALVSIANYHECNGCYSTTAKIRKQIGELLNYLPEVQFGEEFQEFKSFRFQRKLPQEPPIYAVERAKRFDTREHEILRLVVRYRDGND